MFLLFPLVAAIPQSAKEDLFAAPKFQLTFGSVGDTQAQDFVVANINSIQYTCAIPQIQSMDQIDKPADLIKLKRAKRKILKNGAAALLKLKDEQCLYNLNGWWVYEFCFKKHVRQFHPRSKEEELKQPDKKQDYILGKFSRDSELELDNEVVDGKTANFLRTVYAKGTKCDVGEGIHRSVEIQITSHQSEVDFLMLETTSCVYVISVLTPKLCEADPSFIPHNTAKANVNEILCEASSNAKTLSPPKVPGKYSIHTLFPKSSKLLSENIIQGVLNVNSEELASQIKDALKNQLGVNVAVSDFKVVDNTENPDPASNPNYISPDDIDEPVQNHPRDEIISPSFENPAHVEDVAVENVEVFHITQNGQELGPEELQDKMINILKNKMENIKKDADALKKIEEEVERLGREKGTDAENRIYEQVKKAQEDVRRALEDVERIQADVNHVVLEDFIGLKDDDEEIRQALNEAQVFSDQAELDHHKNHEEFHRLAHEKALKKAKNSERVRKAISDALRQKREEKAKNEAKESQDSLHLDRKKEKVGNVEQEI